MRTILSYCFYLSVLLFLPACEHKELCYDHNHTAEVQVIFDWRNEPEADPKNIWLVLFPDNGKDILTFEFNNRNGGNIEIPVGKYQVLCLNADSRTLLYRNINQYKTFEVYTDARNPLTDAKNLPRAPGCEKEIFSTSPDRLWTDQLDSFEVKLNSKGTILHLYPSWKLYQIHIRISNAMNLKYIDSERIIGSLSHMSGGMLVGSNHATPQPVTIPFKVETDSIATIKADFLSFGHPLSEGTNYFLIIYAILPDGRKFYYTYNVSKQIEAAGNSRDIFIELDGLPFPKPIADDGFIPDLDDWETVYIEVPM